VVTLKVLNLSVNPETHTVPDSTIPPSPPQANPNPPTENIADPKGKCRVHTSQDYQVRKRPVLDSDVVVCEVAVEKAPGELKELPTLLQMAKMKLVTLRSFGVWILGNSSRSTYLSLKMCAQCSIE
jgi:hypothetical protein